MKEEKNIKYYRIRASVFWTAIIVTGLLFSVIICALFKSENTNAADTNSAEHIETMHMEYGSISSKLKNTEECYLCGSHANSLMGYYRKFDTVGIIGLNQWYVLDLRLQAHDENGNKIEDSSGTSTSMGNTSGIDYYVSTIASRGRASATISSTDGMFNKKVVENHLCQVCLDKVTDTLDGYFEKGKEEYLPFCLVDFETLEMYPMQKMNVSYSVRDYWVELDHQDDEVEIKVYYLPER